MKELTKKELEQIINEYNSEFENGVNSNQIKEKLFPKLEEYYCKKAVLGFDIYRYSQFAKFEQTLIPYLFKVLLDMTIRNCIKHEQFIFQNTNITEFSKKFIDTGDGGFQIFETPFHAIIFAIYFETNIKRYNSGHQSTQKIKNIVGEISLRYSLTLDDIYFNNRNYYGTSIINNARIMSKDKLNRFLLDCNTIQWFNQELNGIENLQSIKLKDDFKNLNMFSEYTKVFKEGEETSVLFDGEWAEIISSDILHIGEIKSKLDVLDIYSSHIQARVKSGGDKSFKKYTISLGNLNSSGITD